MFFKALSSQRLFECNGPIFRMALSRCQRLNNTVAIGMGDVTGSLGD
jgi:hypothetical protein